MKVFFAGFGCKVNQYETESIKADFISEGFETADEITSADVIVINSCTVTSSGDSKSLYFLRKARKDNPEAVIVLTGCMPQATPEIAESIPEADIVTGTKERGNIVSLVKEFTKSRNQIVSIGKYCASDKFEEIIPGDFSEKTRAFVKIQDGCNQFCTYCIIPYARGRIRSRKAEEVVREVETLATNGCKEVVLTGIHLSSYGLDHGDNLLHLIQEVHKVEGIRRIRLGSLEPGIIDENFVKELAKLEKICPHFHLSLQSGCDATLKRMNRKYDTATYEAGCKLIRKYFTHPAITTDVIVGFPGETEEEFEATKEFLERIHFYEMHIFKYSKRKGTKAAVMPDQVPEQVKTERSKVLLALAQEMSEEFREYYVGRPEEILLEETDEIAGNVYFTGYTKEYVKIAVPEAEGEENILVKGVVTGRISADVYRMENIEKAE